MISSFCRSRRPINSSSRWIRLRRLFSRPAKAVLTDQGDVLMAVSKYGKGTVFAVVDPWVYSEYVDRRNRLPVDYDGFAAAIDLAGWAVRQAR